MFEWIFFYSITNIFLVIKGNNKSDIDMVQKYSDIIRLSSDKIQLNKSSDKIQQNPDSCSAKIQTCFFMRA